MNSGKSGTRLLLALTMIPMLLLSGCATGLDLGALLRADEDKVAAKVVCPPPLGPLPDSVADALDAAVTADPDGAGSWVNSLGRVYDFQDACAE